MINRIWYRKQDRLSRTKLDKSLMKAFLMILASEVKCEFIEFTADSKMDSTTGTKSKYHGRIIRLKEENNRNEKKFRRSRSQE